MLVGRDSWPIIFSPPRAEDYSRPLLSSENLYVHLPFCRKICHYCPYVKLPYVEHTARRYARSLLHEVEEYLENGCVEQVKSLYFGGGTPSLSLNLVSQVIGLLKSHLDAAAEIAIELHPSDCDPELFERLRNLGFNKVSIGVESFSADTLKTLERAYTPEIAKKAVIEAKRFGFDCVDINLLYAIPGQTVQATLEDVRIAIALQADHISAYPIFSFAHTPDDRNSHRRPEGLAAIRDRILIQKKVSALCLESGYHRTSVWSFTRVEVSPYTTVTRASYRGFGLGAGSKLDEVIWFNSFSIDSYSGSGEIKPALVMHGTERFKQFHWLYWKIYTTEIDPFEYQSIFGRNIERDFRVVFLLMRLFGWLKQTGNTWRVTERGAIFAHLLQSLYSLSYIDILWGSCQVDPRPQTVILE